IEPVDTIAIFWPKIRGIKLSDAAIVKVQANATNVWDSPAVDVTLEIDNIYEVATYNFSTVQNYRYWRVVMSDATNPNGYLELGVGWIGKSLEVENAQNGFTFDLVDKSKTTTNDFGNAYTDEYPLLSTIEFSYQFLE